MSREFLTTFDRTKISLWKDAVVTIASLGTGNCTFNTPNHHKKRIRAKVEIRAS